MYNIVSPHFLHYSPLSSHSNGHKSSPIWILPAEVPLLNAYIILSPYFDELFWMVKSLYFKGLINDVGFPSLVKFPPKVVFFPQEGSFSVAAMGGGPAAELFAAVATCHQGDPSGVVSMGYMKSWSSMTGFGSSFMTRKPSYTWE